VCWRATVTCSTPPQGNNKAIHHKFKNVRMPDGRMKVSSLLAESLVMMTSDNLTFSKLE